MQINLNEYKNCINKEQLKVKNITHSNGNLTQATLQCFALFENIIKNGNFQSPETSEGLVNGETKEIVNKKGEKTTKIMPKKDTEVIVKKVDLAKKKPPKKDAKPVKNSNRKILSTRVESDENGKEWEIQEIEIKKAEYISANAKKPINLCILHLLDFFLFEVQKYENTDFSNEFLKTCGPFSKLVYIISQGAKFREFPVKGIIVIEHEQTINNKFTSAIDEFQSEIKLRCNQNTKLSVQNKNDILQIFTEFVFELIFDASFARYQTSSAFDVKLFRSILIKKYVDNYIKIGCDLKGLFALEKELVASFIESTKKPSTKKGTSASKSKQEENTKQKEEKDEENEENYDVQF